MPSANEGAGNPPRAAAEGVVQRWQRACYRLRHAAKNARARCRGAYWKAQGMRVGAGARVGKIGVTWPHRVAIGEGTVVEDGVRFFSAGTWERSPVIALGRRCFVGRGCDFNAAAGITVRDDCMIAAGCTLVDHDHRFDDPGRPSSAQGLHTGAIEIGAGAWLGARVVVLRGVTIGARAVVGAGAVVRVDVPPGQVWGGVPARCLRKGEDGFGGNSEGG